MGQIRRQTIQSSFLSYIGFVIGAINTYFFTKQGWFTPEQYGLTQVIISISQIVAPMATFGATAFINRFFPYYFDNLKEKQNDMLTIAIYVSGIGAILVFSGCFIFEPLVIRKFSTKSALVVQYYYWTLVFSFSYLCFLILESYLGALKRTVLPNFMKETMYRVCVMVLVALYLFKIIPFNTFVILFCCIYLLIVAIIVCYLLATGQLYLSFTISQVTRRLRKQALTYAGFVYSGLVINGIGRQIDTLALAGARNLTAAGVYSLNQFTAAILQVPYRGLQAIAGPMIAQHWKNKNHSEIDRIYKRASINLLLMSSFLFFNIWLNYNDGLVFLGIDAQFATGKTVFLILGLYNIFELATGPNAAIISTSPAWRFEFYSGVVLLLISIPLNIYMARWMGMEGVAFAMLITYSIYNIIRLFFIQYRFNMFPFTSKTIYAILLTTACYGIAYFLFRNMHGIGGMALRSIVFSGLFIAAVFYFEITPDSHQLLEIVKKRLKTYFSR